MSGRSYIIILKRKISCLDQDLYPDPTSVLPLVSPGQIHCTNPDKSLKNINYIQVLMQQSSFFTNLCNFHCCRSPNSYQNVKKKNEKKKKQKLNLDYFANCRFKKCPLWPVNITSVPNDNLKKNRCFYLISMDSVIYRLYKRQVEY